MCGVMSPPGGMWTSRIGSPAVNTGSHSLRDRVIGSRRACPSAEIDVPVTDSCCFGESRPPGGGLRIGDDDTFVIIGHSVGGDGADGARASVPPGHEMATERFDHVLQPTQTEQIAADVVAQPVQRPSLHADTTRRYGPGTSAARSGISRSLWASSIRGTASREMSR